MRWQLISSAYRTDASITTLLIRVGMSPTRTTTNYRLYTLDIPNRDRSDCFAVAAAIIARSTSSGNTLWQ